MTWITEESTSPNLNTAYGNQKNFQTLYGGHNALY